MFYYAVLLLFSVGCGQIQDDLVIEQDYRIPWHESSEELKPFVAEFEEIFEVNVSYPVYLTDDLPGYTNGICTGFLVDNKKFVPMAIKISKQVWEHGTESARKKLMWHELGHCSLELRHNELEGSVMFFSMSLYEKVNEQVFDDFIEYVNYL